MSMIQLPDKFNRQVGSLVILRIFIGWHLLYEGLIKVANPNWSSKIFLTQSKGIFSGFFHLLASNESLLHLVDNLNMYGLIFIGLGLILGVFHKTTLISGIVLIGLYYLALPPFIGLKYDIPMEGSYLFINKNLIEIVAMFVLLNFPTNKIIGLDRLVYRMRGVKGT
jgi:thiosulfate dehydrogenase (quinone) large subunit